MAGKEPDLSDPKVREQIRKERKKMDCNGIYRGTARDIKASIDVLKYVKAELGFGSRALNELGQHAIVIGQARKELCELYKSTPDFTYKEYLAQTDKNNAMIVKLFTLAEKAQTAGEQSKDPKIAQSADFRKRQGELKTQLASLNADMKEFIQQTRPLLA